MYLTKGAFLKAIKSGKVSVADIQKSKIYQRWLKNDNKLLGEAIKSDGRLLQFGSDSARKNKEIVLNALNHQKKHAFGILPEDVVFSFVDESLLEDDEVLIAGVKSCGERLNIKKPFNEAMLNVVGNRINKQAPHKLKEEKVMLDLIEVNEDAILMADDILKYDDKFLKQAVVKNAAVVKTLSEETKENPELMIDLIKCNSGAIKFVSPELYDDPDFMLQVYDSGTGMISVGRFASENLHSSKYFLTELAKKGACLADFISDEVFNKELVIDLIKENPKSIFHSGAIERLKNLIYDEDVITEFAQKDSLRLKQFFDIISSPDTYKVDGVDYRPDFYDTQVRTNKDIILAGMKDRYRFIGEADPVLLKDKSFMLEAINIDPRAAKFADPSLKQDVEFLKASIMALDAEEMQDGIKNAFNSTQSEEDMIAFVTSVEDAEIERLLTGIDNNDPNIDVQIELADKKLDLLKKIYNEELEIFKEQQRIKEEERKAEEARLAKEAQEMEEAKIAAEKIKQERIEKAEALRRFN